MRDLQSAGSDGKLDFMFGLLPGDFGEVMGKESNKKKHSVKKAQELKKSALMEAVRVNLGNVSKACEAVGIARKTYYEYLKDEDFKDEIDAIDEANIDFSESKLFELINGVEVIGNEGKTYFTQPNVTAIIFHLKTKGKRRGYIEKTETDNTQRIVLEDASE